MQVETKLAVLSISRSLWSLVSLEFSLRINRFSEIWRKAIFGIMTSHSNPVPQLGRDTAITVTQDGVSTPEIGNPHLESITIDSTSRMGDQDDEDISDDDTHISVGIASLAIEYRETF
jgi:hypothetical protein